MSNGNAQQQSLITAEVEITGVIKSAGSVRLDGKLDGDLVCQGDAILGKTATMKGNITAGSVSVEGTVNGTINAKDKIEMKSTAKITGDIKSKRLSVEDGVTFIGKADVNPTGQTTAAKADDDRPSFLGKGGKLPSFGAPA